MLNVKPETLRMRCVLKRMLSYEKSVGIPYDYMKLINLPAFSWLAKASIFL